MFCLLQGLMSGMQFEQQKSIAESAGEKIGKALGGLLFIVIAFFVIGKAKFVCWSWRHFVYFAGVLLLIYVIIEGIRRLSGRNANKIVS